jgi:hypothetical protein
MNELGKKVNGYRFPARRHDEDSMVRANLYFIDADENLLDSYLEM